ncbi:hypothetical protein NDU88_002337 [Pleurodeles waltl]|uniref:Reverse transcriptase domain-containing protein n=1 Tax=Pleurodeles waltl TaxID=8319 RepID=A0AAV7P6M6_PLEWA|nr:hypothetical protein NDU88_002337 [Pleurodeles waltl]
MVDVNRANAQDMYVTKEKTKCMKVKGSVPPMVKEEPEKIEKAGINDKVTSSAPWVSPIVVTKKSKQPRVV